MQIDPSLQKNSFVCRFGKRNGEDIDLLLISPSIESHTQIRIGLYDITAFPPLEAEELFQKKDIIALVPYNSGRILSDDIGFDQKISKAIEKEHSINHLTLHYSARLYHCIDQSIGFLRRYKFSKDEKDLYVSTKSLGWAISYRICLENLKEVATCPKDITTEWIISHDSTGSLARSRKLEKESNISVCSGELLELLSSEQIASLNVASRRE